MSENTEVQIEDQILRLEPNNEFRFEIENRNEAAVLVLIDGLAEIFGRELVKNKIYKFFFGAKIAVFTWQGCSLKLRGKKGIGHISNETPMTLYSNFHSSLEKLREKSVKEKIRGPITMVVGPADVGKSSVCKILLNYCKRVDSVGRTPIYVDLDPGQGELTVPSIIGAALIEQPVEIENSFSNSDRLVYHYGHAAPTNSILYDNLITCLASIVHQRMDTNPKIKNAGLIINTCGYVRERGFVHLIHVAHSFDVSVVLVLDQESLYNELVELMPGYVKTVFLPKSSGVVGRSPQFKSECRKARIREYFYGNPRANILPHTCEVRFCHIKVYRIGVMPVPVRLLPFNMPSTELVRLPPGPNMLHHLLSVTCKELIENIAGSIMARVAGTVCVINVDTSRKRLTLLSPVAELMPNAIYIMSDVQFINSNA